MPAQVHVLDHPLIQHKLSILRDRETSTRDFKQLVSEIAMLMAYEATQDLATEPIEIETPLERMTGRQVSGKKLTLVPILRLYNGTGLTGTFVGIWLVHTGFALPFAIYLMRNFFAALPTEIFEAAAVDGASDRVTLLHIALPVARPALASVAIFQLIWVWNDLLIALIFLGGAADVAPITVALANLVNVTTGQGWELLTAAAFVAVALPMTVFFVLQRHFVRGLLAGAGK